VACPAPAASLTLCRMQQSGAVRSATDLASCPRRGVASFARVKGIVLLNLGLVSAHEISKGPESVGYIPGR